MTDSGTSFNVVVVQFNGGLQRQKVVSVLRVSASGVALHAVDGSVRCQAAYHDQMQVLRQQHLSAYSTDKHTYGACMPCRAVPLAVFDHCQKLLQICGARGGGDGAAQGLFLAFQRGDAYMLVRITAALVPTVFADMGHFNSRTNAPAACVQACESSKQRNVCILLIRKLAATKGFNLHGPVAE